MDEPRLSLAVPAPSALPEFVGPMLPRHDTGRGADLERAVGRALGQAYPWLIKVNHPRGCGMLWACWPGEHAEAANDAGPGLTI